MIKKLFTSLGLTLTLLLFSFLLVLGGEEKPPLDPPSAPLPAKGLVSSQDLSLLAARFGAAVPCLSTTGAGRVEDVPFSEGYAHLLTWTDENQITTTCIRPAAAAYLLRDASYDPTGEYCTIDGMTAIILQSPSSCQLHFGDADTAYCLTYSGNAQVLIDHLQSIQFIQ